MRYHHFGRNPPPHTQSQVVEKCVRDFISTLESSFQKLDWIETKTGDYIRLETIFGSVIIKLTHVVPEMSEASRKQMPKKFVEEYRLEIRDKYQSMGRVAIINEYFGKDSPLFPQISGLFANVHEVARFVEPNTTTRASLPECIMTVSKMLTKL